MTDPDRIAQLALRLLDPRQQRSRDPVTGIHRKGAGELPLRRIEASRGDERPRIEDPLRDGHARLRPSPTAGRRRVPWIALLFFFLLQRVHGVRTRSHSGVKRVDLFELQQKRSRRVSVLGGKGALREPRRLSDRKPPCSEATADHFDGQHVTPR